MKSLKIYFVSLMILTLSSCDEINAPKVERCINLLDYMFCIDKRLDQDQQEYDVPQAETRGYICTNPTDYETMRSWCENQAKDLIMCRRGSSKESRFKIDRH